MMLVTTGLLVTASILVGGSSESHGRTDAWLPQDSGVTVSLRGLYAVDASVAWASGAGGRWLRTTDGGTTWESGQVPGSETLDFRDVHAFGPDTAVLLSAGSPGRIVLTEDGGRTWTVVYDDERPDIFLNCMDFEPGGGESGGSRRGYVVGDVIDGRFQMLTSSDTGRSWQPLSPEEPPEPVAGEAQFAASGTCLQAGHEAQVRFVTGGAAARVFSSNDAGKTWRASATPMLQGESSQGGFSIAFVDSNSGVVVGGDFQVDVGIELNYALSRDGGRTWDSPAANAPRGFRSAVTVLAATQADHGRRWLIAVGPSGTDLSDDGGVHWRALSDEGFHVVSAARSGGAVWAAGSEGRIARLRKHPGGDGS